MNGDTTKLFKVRVYVRAESQDLAESIAYSALSDPGVDALVGTVKFKE